MAFPLVGIDFLSQAHLDFHTRHPTASGRSPFRASAGRELRLRERNMIARRRRYFPWPDLKSAAKAIYRKPASKSCYCEPMIWVFAPNLGLPVLTAKKSPVDRG